MDNIGSEYAFGYSSNNGNRPLRPSCSHTISTKTIQSTKSTSLSLHLAATINFCFQHFPPLRLIKRPKIIHITTSRLDQLPLWREIDALVLEQPELQCLIDPAWCFFPITFEATYEAVACDYSVAGDLFHISLIPLSTLFCLHAELWRAERRGNKRRLTSGA
jgi:hypothetical protein